MKKTVLNFGATIIAFIIGLAINGACAGSFDNMTDTELRKLVSQLQEEVNSLKQQVAQLESLKQQVAQLENKIGGFESSLSIKTSGFDVDGIHFDNSGFPEDKLDYYEVTGYYLNNGVRTEVTPSISKYEYDSKGRVIKQGQYSYSYSEKTYILTLETQSGSNLTHTEYAYHLK